jgi:hypothetical protein
MQQSRALKEINRDDLNDAAFVLVTIFVCFLCDTFTFFSFFFRTTQQCLTSPPPPCHTTNDETPSAAIAVATANAAPAIALNANVRRGCCRCTGGLTVGIPLGRQRRAQRWRRQCARSRWIVVGIRGASLSAPRNSRPWGGGRIVGSPVATATATATATGGVPGCRQARLRWRGLRDCRRNRVVAR